jgi:hypothetical protein
VAVYDFGGGTFDAALVRRDGDGFVLIGRPDGLERFGGIDIDAAIMAYVDDALGGRLSSLDADDAEVQAGVAHLREECRAAKEALSSDSDTSIPVSLPGIQTRVRLTRPELEGMLRPRLIETIEALERTVASAHLTMADVSRILLVGGSSRIPLVGEMLRDRTHRPLAVDAHPKFAIAIGAALHGRAVGASGAAALAAPTRSVSVTPSAPVPPPVLTPPTTPVSAPPPSPPSPPPAPPPPPAAPPVADQPFVPAVVEPATGRSRTPWIMAGLAALVVAVVVGVVLNGGGDDTASGPAADPSVPRSSQPLATPTASTDPLPVETEAPLVSDAPTTTEAPAPTTTFQPVPEPRQLDEVADYLGYRITVNQVSVAPLQDEFTTEAEVTVSLRLTNNGAFEAPIVDLTLQIDGLDTPDPAELLSTPPGTTAEDSITFSVPLDQLDRLSQALLFIGATTENQAVLPLGPDADTTKVVRHAAAGADLAIDMTFGPGSRYTSGSLQVTHTDIGASTQLDQVTPRGKVWLSIDYQVCVQRLDSFFTPTLQLPDGTRVAPEGIRMSGETLHGLPLAVTCPEESVAVAFWAVDPAVVAGQTLTVLLDDEEDDELPGSFTFTPPALPANDVVPS